MALTRKFFKDLGVKNRREVANWLGERNNAHQGAHWNWTNDFLAGSTTCCSAVELSGVNSPEDAKVGVASALVSKDYSVFYYSVNPKINTALKSWGFKEVASFPGNHGRRVRVFFNRIGGRK